MDSGAWPYFVWRLFDSLFFYPDSILCRIEATALGTIVDCSIIGFYNNYSYI